MPLFDFDYEQFMPLTGELADIQREMDQVHEKLDPSDGAYYEKMILLEAQYEEIQDRIESMQNQEQDHE